MDDANDLNSRIGKKILKLREQLKLTTVQLAERVGVSQAQISRLENGKQGFRTSTLKRIAEALEVPTAHFLGDQDEEISRAMANPQFRDSVKQAAVCFLESGAATITVAAS